MDNMENKNNEIIDNQKDEISFSDELLEKLDKRAKKKLEDEKNRPKLYIVRELCYKFGDVISFKDEEVNKTELEERTKENEFFNKVQTAIGYRIANYGEIEIKDIIVPKFTLNPEDNLYYGVEEKVTLKSEEHLLIPKKYLVMLLMRPEFGMKCENARLKLQFNKTALMKKDYDAVLTSMPIICNPEWEEIMMADGMHYPIGEVVYVEGKSEPHHFQIRTNIPEKEREALLERFGNYQNPPVKAKLGRPKTEPKMGGTSEAAKLLAGIINMGR